MYINKNVMVNFGQEDQLVSKFERQQDSAGRESRKLSSTTTCYFIDNRLMVGGRSQDMNLHITHITEEKIT